MGKIKAEIEKFICEKCGYEWTPRKEEVKSCPECKCRNWNEKNG